MARHCLAILLAAFCLSIAGTASAFTIYHSAPDDGSNSGVVPVTSTGTLTLNLWFDPEELIFGYTAFLDSTAGLEMVSFAEEPDVIKNEQFPFRLGINGGDISSGDIAPRRIGTLELNVTDIATAMLALTAGSFVDAGFNNVKITPLPQQIVPEPSVAILVLGGAALALRRSRRV